MMRVSIGWRKDVEEVRLEGTGYVNQRGVEETLNQ